MHLPCEKASFWSWFKDLQGLALILRIVLKSIVLQVDLHEFKLNLKDCR